MIFHVFTEEHLRKDFLEKIDVDWPTEFRSKFDLEFHSIEYPRGNDERWRSLFKPCCTQRLFFPELLLNVDSLIYIDTDVLFLSNTKNLWRFFRQFNSTQLSALSPEHEDPAMGWYNRFARHPFYGSMGLNSGVMLMNLTRMRQVKMIDEILEIFDEFHSNITWGDQCLLNIYFNYHPDRLYQIDCEWNYRPDHCIYENNCQTATKNGVQILHGSRSAFHNEKYEEFKSIYRVIDQWNFDQNLHRTLVVPLKNSFKRFSTTNCGKTSDLFVKQISKEISASKFSSSKKIHLAIVIRNDWHQIDQFSILFKSFRLFQRNESKEIHFHVFVTDRLAQNYFSDQINASNRFVSFYNASIDNPMEILNKLNVDRVIFLHSNLIFVDSIEILWNYFEKFSSKQILGVFAQCHLTGFSTILLLHLENFNLNQLNIVGLNQISTENVFFLPCKFLLMAEQCRSIDESLFLPEIIDPSLFIILSQTIQRVSDDEKNFEKNSFAASIEKHFQCQTELVQSNE